MTKIHPPIAMTVPDLRWIQIRTAVLAFIFAMTLDNASVTAGDSATIHYRRVEAPLSQLLDISEDVCWRRMGIEEWPTHALRKDYWRFVCRTGAVIEERVVLDKAP